MPQILASLLATALLIPALALGDTLELPEDAEVEFEVIDRLTLEGNDEVGDIVLRPVPEGTGSHSLPEYCVATGDARRDGDRVRLTAHALTCIETDGSDSAIYSDEVSASGFDLEGGFGIAACDDGRCELAPGDGFLLRFGDEIAIEQQANPSAEINERRRQAEGEGVANPVPADAPDPDED
jgi:hypothetical protein